MFTFTIIKLVFLVDLTKCLKENYKGNHFFLHDSITGSSKITLSLTKDT